MNTTFINSKPAGSGIGDDARKVERNLKAEVVAAICERLAG